MYYKWKIPTEMEEVLAYLSFSTLPTWQSQALSTDTKDTKQHKTVCIQKVTNKKGWRQASLSKLMKGFDVLQTL